MSLSFPHGLTLFSLFTSSRERERYKDTSSREREKEREREAKVIFRLNQSGTQSSEKQCLSPYQKVTLCTNYYQQHQFVATYCLGTSVAFASTASCCRQVLSTDCSYLVFEYSRTAIIWSSFSNE